jgi:hypothetical protein
MLSLPRCDRLLAAWLFLATCLPGVAAAPLHRDVLVFVPAYEGSQLFDPDLTDATAGNPTKIWVNLGAYFSRTLYFALRNPNPLEARPLQRVGPLDVYSGFYRALTQPSEGSHFAPYTLGADFFVFSYDWRQEIATVTAPSFAQALQSYAQIHAARTGLPAARTRFIIVTHSMGGLVARTWLSENPGWAPRVARLYLVGPPNRGSIKAVKTVVTGPESLSSFAQGFPGLLVDLVPTNVDQNVTKLTGISRPSLYELLPYDDPHWFDADTQRQTPARALLDAATWQPYWPSAELERRLFLDDWLKERREEGRKQIVPADWEFCQDPSLPQLHRLLRAAAAWRARQGTLAHTASLLTLPGQATRLRLVLGAGVVTPDGVVTRGTHDTTRASYTYQQHQDGDGTVATFSALDGLAADAPHVHILKNTPHGRLMIDPGFLSYFLDELSRAPMISDRGPKAPLHLQPQ